MRSANRGRDHPGWQKDADRTPRQFLQCDPLIHVNDPNGLFTSDDLTRVHGAVDAVVEPCGGRGVWQTKPRGRARLHRCFTLESRFGRHC